MERQEIEQLLGGEPAAFEHNIMIWIPSVTMENWTIRFVNLMTGLFGGATAIGVRSRELCDELAKATGLPTDVLFSPMATAEGGDLPEARRRKFNEKFRPLLEEVLTQNEFSDKNLSALADPDIIREPVTIVESYASESDLLENLKFVKILLLQMGRETRQVEVGILVDDVFRKYQIS